MSKQKEETKRIKIAIESQSDALTGSEIQKKIAKLEAYIIRADGRIALHTKNLKNLREMSEKDKALLKIGLEAMDIKNNQEAEV